MKENRVRWDSLEIETLAKAFVAARIADPFRQVGPLMDKVQKEFLEPNRRREFAPLTGVPALHDRIVALWQQAVSTIAPVPRIIEIDVPRPVDFAELASRLDTPTLMALLTSRIGEALEHLRLPATAGGASAHKAKPVVPSGLSLLAATAPKLRPPRVAFCGMNLEVFNQLTQEIQKKNIPVELRFVDTARHDPQLPVSSDFVVFAQGAIVGSSTFAMARSNWPQDRVFVVGNNTASAVEKLRELGARQIPV